MKKSELSFNIASIFVDAAMIIASGSVAYFLRYRVENFIPQYPVLFDLSYGEFLKNILMAIPVLLIVFALYGLYKVKSTRGFREVSFKVTAAISTGLMLFVAVYFFNPEIFPSRLIVLMSWIFTIITVNFGRLVVLLVERAFLKRGIGLHRLVLIVGWNKDFSLRNEIIKRPELGYKIIETLDGNGEIIDQLEKIQKEGGIDEIIQANYDLDRSTNSRILRFTHDNGITFNYVPDILEAQRSNISISDISGIPVVELRNTPLDGWGRVVKRLLDITLSIFFIIILSPLIVVIFLMIKFSSPGKTLYIQERFGQGKPFRFYKFRSMHQHLSVGDEYGGESANNLRDQLWQSNARSGPFLKIKNDPRVTKIGKFLRRTKLDELPQLFNVLKGDMSMVGPRAHVIEEVKLYRDRYRRQFTVKPGVTGLAQISQVNDPDLSFDEEIKLNTFYIENWSLGLDFQVFVRTAIVLLKGILKKQDY